VSVSDPASPPARRPIGPVSVVVVNYNGAEHLPACLDALSALEGPVDEVIVVDNASTDGSRALAEQRAAAARETAGAPELRVVALATNDGPCPARNRGMREARNRWVLALDNDAVCRPDLLAKLAAAAEARADCVIVQPRSVFASEPGRVHYDGGGFHYAGLISLRNWYRPLAEARGDGVLDVDCAVSLALLVDRDALLAAGGYDEAFFILFEDLDLSYRLRAAGRAILSVEDALVLHRGGTPGISFREGPRYPVSRVRLHSRNRWLFLLKNYRVRTLLVALPGLFAYELVWLAFSVASGGLGAWVLGKVDVLRLLGRTLHLRRAARRARRASDRSLLVGGPLTVTPALQSSALRRGALAALDCWMRAWWGLARHVAG
jgi:GT2 family glycosyltransferase